MSAATTPQNASSASRRKTAACQIGALPQVLISFGTDDAGHLYAIGYEGMICQLDFSETRFDEIKAE
jgi:hypothetical protein